MTPCVFLDLGNVFRNYLFISYSRNKYALTKIYKNKSRHNFINNLPSTTCFGFVSHLKTEYTVVL